MLTGPELLAILLGALALIVAIAVFMSFAAVRRRLITDPGSRPEESILEAVSTSDRRGPSAAW